jgi:hypothetical protein
MLRNSTVVLILFTALGLASDIEKPATGASSSLEVLINNAGSVDGITGSDGSSGNLTISGTVDATTLTEGTNAVRNVSEWGAGIDTFLITPSSGNLASALTDEVGNAGGFTRGTAGLTDECVKWDAGGNLVSHGAACGGGGGYDTIDDEGTPLTQRTTLNFTGAGVTCVDDGPGTETDCDIPGGGSSNAFLTIGNAVADTTTDTLTITDGFFIDLTTTNDPEDLTADLLYTQTLAGNPTLNAEECGFTTDGAGGGGFICEGTVGGGANANEQLYLFPAVDGADTANFIAVNANQITDFESGVLAVAAGALDVGGNTINATHVDETGAFAFSNTTNTFVGASYTSPSADPAEGGVVRVGNAEDALCAELATPGTDRCLQLNTSDDWQLDGELHVQSPNTGTILIAHFEQTGSGNPFIRLQDTDTQWQFGIGAGDVWVIDDPTVGGDLVTITQAGKIGFNMSPALDLSIKDPAVGSAAELHLLTDDTGDTATDGLRVGISAANLVEIMNHENAAMQLGTNGSARWQIGAAGTLTPQNNSSLDLTNSTTLTVPVSAGAGPTANGTLAYDSTANALEYGDNGTNRTVMNLDEAQTATSKTLDEANNSITLSHYIEYAAAGCQAASAFSGFTWDSTDAPSAVNCIDGTNVDSGSLSFADAVTDRIHGSFWLPADWTGNIDISGVWRSATASTNTVRWNIETRCVADAEVIEGSWNTAQNIDDAGKGTTLQINTLSLAAITTTGCAADEMFFWRFSRIGGDGADTFAGSADLLKLRFRIRRDH